MWYEDCYKNTTEAVVDRGRSMKKLLLTEGLIACFFLALFLGFFGKYLSRGQKQGEWGAEADRNRQQDRDGLTVYSGVLQERKIHSLPIFLLWRILKKELQQ